MSGTVKIMGGGWRTYTSVKHCGKHQPTKMQGDTHSKAGSGGDKGFRGDHVDTPPHGIGNDCMSALEGIVRNGRVSEALLLHGESFYSADARQQGFEAS